MDRFLSSSFFLLASSVLLLTRQCKSSPTPPIELDAPAVFSNFDNHFQLSQENKNDDFGDLWQATPATNFDDLDQTDSANKAGGVCVDYTIEGYYNNRVHYDGNPPSGFIQRPSAITPCQLEQLHQMCVDRINMYRNGELKFSDGSSDSAVNGGLTSVNSRLGSQQCSSEAAMGDLIANYAGGGRCAGAHLNAFVCPGGGGKAQTSCCGRGDGSGSSASYDTFESVVGIMNSCLQMMWDEGINSGEKGHWEIMRSSSYSYVSCGFAWSEGGRVFITQDYYTSDSSCSPSCGSCGGSDTCSSNPCSCNAGSVVASSTPSSSPAPSSSKQPSSSRQPSPSKQPSASSEPSSSKEPSSSRQPSSSRDPSPSSEPSSSMDPSASREPSASKEPSQSPKPSASNEPSGTAEPSPSSQPSPSNEADPLPTPSKAPLPQQDDDKPAPSRAPSHSRQPSSSPEPSPSAQSGSTGKNCVSVSLLTSDQWCNASCNHVPSYCPSSLCECS